MWCGFISLDQFRFKGGVIEGTQTISMAGGRFLSYQECVGEAREGRRIGSRGDAYASSFSIGFPSITAKETRVRVYVSHEPRGEEWE